ncbi:MAG: hypothetical protein E3J23_08580 [Candidatus Stahlbacteria bacterium]|nr:MAG: hypothetical protein E3J23_08580 [Candidatus Stahlbacteria bacterium]
MIDKGFYTCLNCKGIYINNDGANRNCSNCIKDPGVDTNKNIGELLMLIVSELGEALEAHRNNKFTDWSGYKMLMDIHNKKEWSRNDLKKENLKYYFECKIKDTFEDEIADVFLRLFDLCGYLGIEPKEYPLLEMQTFKNIGAEFFWLTGMLTNLPGIKIYYDQSDSIDKEVEEISLVIKRLECFCEQNSIPIEKHILAKMEYNKERPHKHGKEY